MPINLKVLLPFQIFVDKKGVKRIVARTLQGSLGLLPHRLDCAAALAPGILTYETEEEGEVYLAVDQGVLVKAGVMFWSRCATRSAERTSTSCTRR